MTTFTVLQMTDSTLDKPKGQAKDNDASNHSFPRTLMLNKAEKLLNTALCLNLLFGRQGTDVTKHGGEIDETQPTLL